jgi:hypothetical protein
MAKKPTFRQPVLPVEIGLFADHPIGEAVFRANPLFSIIVDNGVCADVPNE